MPHKLIPVICKDCGTVRETRAGRDRLPERCNRCARLCRAEKFQKRSIEVRTLRPYEWIYRVLLRQAKEKNRTITLTYEEFLTFVHVDSCHYCNASIPKRGVKSKGSYANTFLDRKDNDRGYEADNLVVCCPRCNRVKSSEFTYEEFKILVQTLIHIDNLRKEEK